MHMKFLVFLKIKIMLYMIATTMTKWINEVEFVCFPHYVVPAVPVEVKTAAGLSGL